MAHPEQLNFIKKISQSITKDYSNLRILEIGSYDVNGSIRKFFPDSNYIGVDLSAGPGVDIVCEGNKLDHPNETYEITLSCECFEHNPFWIETFENMLRMTKSGGVVIFTCATTGRPEHGTTRTSPAVSPGSQSVGWDYYQNLTEVDFRNQFQFDEIFDSYFFLTNERSCDLYFFGVKHGALQAFDINSRLIKELCIQGQLDVERLKKKEKLTPKFLRPLLRRLFD